MTRVWTDPFLKAYIISNLHGLASELFHPPVAPTAYLKDRSVPRWLPKNGVDEFFLEWQPISESSDGEGGTRCRAVLTMFCNGRTMTLRYGFSTVWTQEFFSSGLWEISATQQDVDTRSKS